MVRLRVRAWAGKVLWLSQDCSGWIRGGKLEGGVVCCEERVLFRIGEGE